MVRTARACVWTDEPCWPLRAISHVCVAGCGSSAFYVNTGLQQYIIVAQYGTTDLSSLIYNPRFKPV